ncbi:MAG: hypothetical protein FWD69_04985 [Polyangiaceae bacterium]|nr:hypothetical protein [Polyangiaceae bacterium]
MNDPVDLLALDRDVRRAHERVFGMRATLDTAEGRLRARSFDPFEDLRRVAGRTTFFALRERAPSAHDAPLRDALVRWTYELLQARIDQDLAIDDADAVHEGLETYFKAWRAILTSDTLTRAALALERAGELSTRVSGVRNERRARRWEIARRLGLTHPSALATARLPSDLSGFARSLLDRTDLLAADVLKQARRRADIGSSAPSAAFAMRLALARDAGMGWPAHLGARWLSEAFRALHTHPIDLRTVPKLPLPLGAASFLRAACAWGFAVRTSAPPRSLPFALSRDPYPASAHRFGFAFASAVADPVFQRKVLGLPARVAASQARSLTISMLLFARTLAARWLLSVSERTDCATFDELGERVFGAPLPPSLHGAWPKDRIDEPSRLFALLGTLSFVRDLRNRFDEDWFFNPRAGTHLMSLACAPAWDDEPIAENVPARLAQGFEEALG